VQISLRVTFEEMTMMHRLAKDSDMSLAKYIVTKTVYE